MSSPTDSANQEKMKHYNKPHNIEPNDAQQSSQNEPIRDGQSTCLAPAEADEKATEMPLYDVTETTLDKLVENITGLQTNVETTTTIIHDQIVDLINKNPAELEINMDLVHKEMRAASLLEDTIQQWKTTIREVSTRLGQNEAD